MSSERDSAKGSAPAARESTQPKPDVLNCDYEPFRLDDLLCGLEPLPDGGDHFTSLHMPSLEPALLLTEIAQPSPVGDGGWTAESAPVDLPAEHIPTIPVTPTEALRQAEPDAMVDTLATVAETPGPAPVEHGETAELTAMVDALIAACSPVGRAGTKGDAQLPQQTDALALLLSDPPPAQDFAALDALYACWPKTTQNSSSRALLAVAQNLSRNFGLPDKLPMSSSKAWHMLSPVVFQDELAQRLIDVGTFIADWQKTQHTFLILEFNEVELIEYLFEALDPASHADLLVNVMNYKVLSNRRMGLLRRIPNRLKRQIAPLLPERKDEALVILAHTKALLERVANPSGFAPIVDTAGKVLDELDKMMKATAAAGAPPPPTPPGGGLALGRMG